MNLGANEITDKRIKEIKRKLIRPCETKLTEWDFVFQKAHMADFENLRFIKKT